MTIDEIIKDMQEQVDSCKKYNERADQASWNYKIGILINLQQAQLLISALQSSMTWKKYPEERPEEGKEYLVQLAYTGTFGITTYLFGKFADYNEIVIRFAEIKHPK